jgi:hypothetical protein
VSSFPADLADLAADGIGIAFPRFTRMNGEAGAEVRLTSCWAPVGSGDRQRRVSMSIWQKLAAIDSSISASIAAISRSGSASIFFGFVWKWSPWMKTGPTQPSRMAAASITTAYSSGRWSV